MSHLRRLTLAASLPAFAALWIVGLGAPMRCAAGDPPMNPTKPEPGMGDPAKPDPAMGDPAKPDPAKVDPNAAKKAVPVPQKDAWEELQHLNDFLKNTKSDNSDILGAMDAVNNAYHNFTPTAPPASPAEQAAFDADTKLYTDKGEKAWLVAYKLKRVKGNSKTNDRDDVNAKAIEILGTSGSPRAKELTTQIIQILEETIFKAKDYDPPTTIFDASFKAVALLNEQVGFDWMLKDYTRYDNSPNAPEKTKAAFDALILFKAVKGTDRFDLVKKITTDWVGVENAAEINKDKNQRAQKQVWDKLKASVIKCLQVYCGEPKGKAGALMGSVKDLKAWFDDHSKPHDPAWADAKPVK